MAKRDLLIIGGGAAGLVVASVAAQLGLKTTLVESSGKLGGDCLHTGCIPSKSLIAAARVAHQLRRAALFGMPGAPLPGIDLAKVNARVQEIIDSIQLHDDPERFRGYGCEVIFGRAVFTGPDTVEVDGKTLQARRFVIATGSSPVIPDTPGLASVDYQTNETIFRLSRLPRQLVVIGGGPIGIELAQAYQRLGSDVTVIQRNPTILPREEPEVVARLVEQLQGEGMRLMTGVEVSCVSEGDYGKRIHCLAGDGTEYQITADTLLLAVGRRANVGGLGLEAAGVAFSGRGIQVDRRLRTSNPRIYACGDVAGPYQFTHMAEYQAGIVISNAIFRVPKRTDYRVVPWVTYCDPELARVGLSESEAQEQGLDHDVLKFDLKDIDRAITERETPGLMKLIVKKGPGWRGGGRILGASILAPHAGELLHEIVLAMQANIPISKISATIHAYPTLAQVHRRTVNTFYGRKLFSPASLTLVRWINRLIP